MDKRSFLTGLLGVSAAPAIVKASSLMPIWTPKTYLWAMPGKNDALALWELINDRPVIDLKTGLSTDKLIATGAKRRIHYQSYDDDGSGPKDDLAVLWAVGYSDNLLIYRSIPFVT